MIDKRYVKGPNTEECVFMSVCMYLNNRTMSLLDSKFINPRVR